MTGFSILARIFAAAAHFVASATKLHPSVHFAILHHAIPRPPRPSRDAIKLRRENHDLAIRLLRVREELQTAERHRVGLKVALSVREKRIDALTVENERLRAQNRRLDQEAERLAEMVQLAPPADPATPATTKGMVT